MTYSTAPAPCDVAGYGEVEDYTINVLGVEPWLTADILSGTLESGGITEVTVSFNSQDLEPGMYSGALYFTSNDPEAPISVVTADLEVTANMGTLSGYVTDALAKGPVQGVTILAEEIRYSTTTDENGYYEMLLPVDNYVVTAQKAGYNTVTVQPVMIELETNTPLDFVLEFAAPVLLAAEGNYYDVTTSWEGNPLFTGAKDGSTSGMSTSNELEMNVKATKAELMHGPTSIVPAGGSSRAIGDTCSEPIVVGALPYTDVNTTCGRGNSYSETCLGYYDGGEDIIYELVLDADMTLEIAMTTTTTYTGMLISDECPATATCIAFATNSGAGGVTITEDLVAGTYYIMIDTWPSPVCIPEFTLTISEGVIQPGESCETAVTAVEGPNLAPQQPYWYEFTPTEDKEMTISSCIDGQTVDTYLEVYDACDGNLVAFNDDLYAKSGDSIPRPRGWTRPSLAVSALPPAMTGLLIWITSCTSITSTAFRGVSSRV